MVSITVSVPADVRASMKKFPEVNWSGLVRSCISERARNLELREELLKRNASENGFNEWAAALVRQGRKRI